jgi:hypothetical protein
VVSSCSIWISARKRRAPFCAAVACGNDPTSPGVMVLAPSGRRGATASMMVTVSRTAGNRSAILRGSGRGSHSGMWKTMPSSKMPRAWISETVPFLSASASSSAPTRPHGSNHSAAVVKPIESSKYRLCA